MIVAFLQSTATPNHALQRTATAVTAPASGLRLSLAMQGPRQPPRSLSLGSLGDYAHMRITFLFLTLFLLGTPANATSYHFSLARKVQVCDAVLLVTVTHARAPHTTSAIEPAICRANVIEVLKSSKPLRTVEFRYLSRGQFQLSTLPKTGQTYIVFLHEHDGRFWVLEGEAGIRSIARTYRESRFEGRKLVKEIYEHAEFVSTILRLARI